MWTQTGNQQTKTILEQQLHSGRIAQCYLFLGPSNSGKASAAWDFATVLSNGQLPLEASADKGIEQLQNCLNLLAYKQINGQKQVLIIRQGHKLSRHGQATLLKTLEEPKSGAVIIITADRPCLHKTIISRCHIIRFSYQKQLAETQNNVAKALLTKYQNFPERPLYHRLSQLKELSNLEDTEMEMLLACWQRASKREVSAANLNQWLKRQRALLEAASRLQENANKKFIVQYLCTSL